MTGREEALLLLRAERDRLDREAEQIRLRKRGLDDLIMKLAVGGISAQAALESVK